MEDVVDGRTFVGLVDLGWRQYMHRHLQLAGMEFPDIRRLHDKVEREHAETLWRLSKPALSSILLYREDEPEQDHGRTILIAPHTPNKHGRSLVNAYVPCRNESFDHPHLTRRIAGFVLLNVVHYMQYLGERGFDVAVGKEILTILEPCDFTK